MTARKLINSANQYMEFRDYFYLYEAIGYWDIIFFCIYQYQAYRAKMSLFICLSRSPSYTFFSWTFMLISSI